MPPKFDAFGFNTVRVNGNDEEEIDRALCEADNVKGRPTCIVMDTVKGEGVSIFKNMGFANHSCNVSAEQLETALAELGGLKNGSQKGFWRQRLKK